MIANHSAGFNPIVAKMLNIRTAVKPHKKPMQHNYRIRKITVHCSDAKTA